MAAPSRTRSGGRSEQIRLAVGAAVLGLLAEGRVDFTVTEVAERAGISRRTIYRWWPESGDLLAEALKQHVRAVAVPDSGNWASDAREFAHRIADFAAAPVDLALARVIASGHPSDLAAAVMAHYAPVLDSWNQMFKQALARGEVSRSHSPQTVISTLVAPLFLAPLMTGRAPSPDVVDRLVDLVLVATAPDSNGRNHDQCS